MCNRNYQGVCVVDPRKCRVAFILTAKNIDEINGAFLGVSHYLTFIMVSYTGVAATGETQQCNIATQAWKRGRRNSSFSVALVAPQNNVCEVFIFPRIYRFPLKMLRCGKKHFLDLMVLLNVLDAIILIQSQSCCWCSGDAVRAACTFLSAAQRRFAGQTFQYFLQEEKSLLVSV